jgi:hypothetical protein
MIDLSGLVQEGLYWAMRKQEALTRLPLRVPILLQELFNN